MPDQPPPANGTAAYESIDPLEAGLALAFGPGESVLAGLQRSLPGLRPVSLREPAGEGSGVVERPKSPELPPAGGAGRYQVFAEVARGGMGAILRGRDPDLGRDIAIKVLREDHRNNPRMVERFVEEAQVCGQLQHPGVPPVHEFGTFADGRPYFTMKLVKGRTLAALFADRADPADGRARLIGIFAQICQTVAYAHARGVIHRDLKPANVMVGAFGEVQVMDWGLAKVLASGGIDDELKASRGRKPPEDNLTAIKTARTAGSTSETQAGSLLGTPAYMSPEQARGDVELLDDRCDVFGLGAVLCELLTGRPPFVGESAAEVQRKAAVAALEDAFARLDGCGADADLIALAKRCLAAEPWDRPRHAGAVAEAVAQYQAEAEARLHLAQLAHAEAHARAEEAIKTAAAERRAQRLTAGLATAALVLLTAGGSGVWWLREQREGAERGAEAALRESEALRERSRVPEALAAAKRAEALAGRAGAAVQARVGEAVADLTMLVRLDDIRLEGSAVNPQASVFDMRRTIPLYEQAFRNYGIDVTTLSDDEAAERIRGRSIRAELLAALDEWLRLSPVGTGRDHLLRVATVADPEPDGLMNRLRHALVRNDNEAIRRLAIDSNLRGLTPITLHQLGHALVNADLHTEAVRVLTVAQEQFPGDFWINQGLAWALSHQKPPRTEEAIRFCTAALALRRSPGVYVNLGLVLCDHARRYPEAEAAFRRAIELQSDYATAHYNLGVVLSHQNRPTEAEAAYRKAIELKPDHAMAYNNLGNLLRQQNRPAEAEAAYRKALQLAATDSAKAYVCGQLAIVLAHQQRWDQALAMHEEAQRYGRVFEVQFDEWFVVLQQLNRVDDALAELRGLATREPQNAQVLVRLGRLLRFKQDYDGAIQAFRVALAIQPDRSDAIFQLGHTYREAGRLDEAIATWREVVQSKPDDAIAHFQLGNVLRYQARFEDAVAAYRRALRLDPEYRWAAQNLGIAYSESGQMSEAIAALRDHHTSHSWYRWLVSVTARGDKLQAVRTGSAKPAGARELSLLAALCYFEKRYALGTRLYAEAVAADAALLTQPAQGGGGVGGTYNPIAASCAARAGTGQGIDAGDATDADRAGFRRLARQWLDVMRSRWEELAAATPSQRPNARRAFQYWGYLPDFAGVRDPEGLAKLPDAERPEWQQFWADVARLAKPPAPAKPEGK